MSQAADESIEGQDIGQEEVITQGSEEQSTGLNPAWNELMQVLPSSLHSLVTPHLQKWDQNYQEGIGKVHSEYESWKPFKEQGIAPEQVTYGLQLLDAIENRPEEIFEALKNYLQVEDDPQTEETQEQEEQGQQSTPIDIASTPEFQQLAQMVNAMAELTVQQNTQQLDAQADTELENEFTAAHENHGDFDEKWVMVQMLADENLTIDQAVQAYKEFEQGILTKANRPGPRVLSPGGGTPNPGVNPSQLDEKGRKSMIANMLAQAAQQNG